MLQNFGFANVLDYVEVYFKDKIFAVDLEVSLKILGYMGYPPQHTYP